MCAQFVLKAKANELSLKYGIKLSDTTKEWDIRPRGFIKTDLAPVLVFKDNQIQIKEMNFSLCPSWSNEFPCKWSTYNARLERPNPKNPSTQEFIYQVPTWRDAFNKGQTCLVPMNAAIESSYFGTHAGQMIKLKVKNDELFFVAGIWSEWLDKSSGEIKETFTLLTDDPYEFFFKSGHDRSVIVLNENASLEWLKNNKFKPVERFDFIRKNRTSLDWDVETDREMNKGWEKKNPTEKEISEIKVWKN
jgi:putative SOS response-associated peptidase YedK